MKVEIEAEKIWEFKNLKDWVNNAQKVFKGIPKSELFICINAKGLLCHIGADFKKTEEFGHYPVTVYRLSRSNPDYPASFKSEAKEYANY